MGYGIWDMGSGIFNHNLWIYVDVSEPVIRLITKKHVSNHASCVCESIMTVQTNVNAALNQNKIFNDLFFRGD